MPRPLEPVMGGAGGVMTLEETAEDNRGRLKAALDVRGITPRELLNAINKAGHANT